MNLSLYLTQKQGKYLCYTPERMATIEVTQPILSEDGSPAMVTEKAEDGKTDVQRPKIDVYKLDSLENVTRWFAHKGNPLTKVDIVLKDWLDRDNTTVESAIMEFDSDARQYRRNAARWEGVVVEKAVLAWDMWKVKPDWGQTASEEILANMPHELAGALKVLISAAVYGGVDDADFFG